MTSTHLVNLVERYMEHPHSAERTYEAAFNELGMTCPADLASLDGESKGGFFEERHRASPNLHSPDDLVHPEVLELTGAPQSGRLAVVHCYDLTYLCLEPTGRWVYWSAEDGVSWGDFSNLGDALADLLRI